MKKIRIVALAAVLMAMPAPKAAGQAEKYTPTTTWPYMYEEFRPGRLTTYQGTAMEYDQLNVSLANGRAHFIRDGKIMEADVRTVALMTIGEDSYVCASGAMMKVLKNTLHGAVVLSTTVDQDAMNKADIGYGKSSLASTQSVSATALSGNVDYNINRSLDDVSRARKEGEKLVLKEVRGIYYRGAFVPATRTDVLNIRGIDKAAVKSYIKAEKIRFSNVDDLGRLADYLYSL